MAHYIPLAAGAAMDLLCLACLAAFWAGYKGFPHRQGANDESPAVTINAQDPKGIRD